MFIGLKIKKRKHVIKLVKKILLRYSKSFRVVKKSFDADYYLSTYDDVRDSGIDPLMHYMHKGWVEGRNPAPYFNTISYLLCNPDVYMLGINPFYHFLEYGRKEGREGVNENDVVKKYLKNNIFIVMQDITFPVNIQKADKILVIVVPEHATMSGGIYSMFSIASIAKRLKSRHGYEVVLMTRPNEQNCTYCRQKNFRNAEDVYRFEQIVRCEEVNDLYIHIPEYATTDFIDNLSPDVLDYLKTREKLNINILNQNTELMPEAYEFEKLRELADELSQSVAHHAYFSQEFSDRYDLPTMLLPAYTDLSAYTASAFKEKDDIIIYSLDESPHKEACIRLLESELPEYQLIEIRDITFEEYMDLATRCKFSISFGEGFDGYVAQPIYQGGIGLTVYNEDFFPSEEFIRFENFFESEKKMEEHLVDTIKKLSEDEKSYSDLNRELVKEYEKLYQYEDYVDRVLRVIDRRFELLPKSRVPGGGVYKIN